MLSWKTRRHYYSATVYSPIWLEASKSLLCTLASHVVVQRSRNETAKFLLVSIHSQTNEVHFIDCCFLGVLSVLRMMPSLTGNAAEYNCHAAAIKEAVEVFETECRNYFWCPETVHADRAIHKEAFLETLMWYSISVLPTTRSSQHQNIDKNTTHLLHNTNRFIRTRYTCQNKSIVPKYPTGPPRTNLIDSDTRQLLADSTIESTLIISRTSSSSWDCKHRLLLWV